MESSQNTTLEAGSGVATSSLPTKNAGIAIPPSPLGRPAFVSWTPQTQAEKSAIQSQLELLLVHPLFFQSKRYPALLRFVVEQTLAGNADQVKERSVGMEVFGRPPGYDANADPVVRVTAGEIRKRLAQYYYDPSHTHELRIELPTGSYVPVFLRFVESTVDPTSKPVSASAPNPATFSSDRTSENPDIQNFPQNAVPESPGQAPAEQLSQVELQQPLSPQPLRPHLLPSRLNPIAKSPPTHHPLNHLAVNLLLVMLALAAGFTTGYLFHQHRSTIASTNPSAEQSLVDFWQPLTAGPATVTFCLGEPARDSSHDADPSQPIRRSKLSEPLYFRLHESGLFALADVSTVTRMTGPLQKQHKNYRVLAASEASFAQLREGPAVLIGAFDNLWTMRLTRDLRFGFESVDGDAAIVDRKSSTRTTWFTSWDLPYEKLARDYAIIARYRDSVTGQPVVIAAGISEEGTEAAGELISNPQDLAELLSKAPANWRNMNLEAVIETQVIDGHSGPPKVRAVNVW